MQNKLGFYCKAFSFNMTLYGVDPCYPVPIPREIKVSSPGKYFRNTAICSTCYQQAVYAVHNVPWFYFASHMIIISSHTDILYYPHVKQIRIHSRHISAGLMPPPQLLLGMYSLNVWSLAPLDALRRDQYLANAILVP